MVSILDYFKPRKVVVKLRFYHHGGRKGGCGYYWLARKNSRYLSLEEVGRFLGKEKVKGKAVWKEIWELPVDVVLIRRHYGWYGCRDREIPLKLIAEGKAKDSFIEVVL